MCRALAIVLLIFLTACSIPTTPQTKIYSLNMPVDNKAEDKHFDTSLVIIMDSPRYLSQPYIVSRNSPYELSISKYSKWDIPPSAAVSEGIRDYLSGIFKEVIISGIEHEDFYSLKIKLKKFERTDEGNDSFGTLVFDYYFVAPDGRYLYKNTISKSEKLNDRSFQSLAKGMSEALRNGIEEVWMCIIKNPGVK